MVTVLFAANHQLLKVRTYYANSPMGSQVDVITGGARDTGAALRKFVYAASSSCYGLADTPTTTSFLVGLRRIMALAPSS